jgi:IrrE N-terminal-like domain
MSQILEMPTLYKRLSEVGLPKTYIQKHALPEWWDSELEKDPVAVIEAAGYIAKRLGLDITSVLSPDVPIVFKKRNNPKFKKRQGTDEECLFIVQGLACRVAEMVTYASKSTFKDTVPNASEIRRQILKNRPGVDLDGLLQFCWSSGLPVVHFSADLPPNCRKLDGMAAQLNNCPAIVIISRQRSSARLAFILAHELGHIACGHVKNGIIIDEDINEEEQDIEEIEANDFAIKLLFGERSYQWTQTFDISLLVCFASIKGKKDKIDPGAIISNYGWTKKNWEVAGGALKTIEPQANAPAKINSYLDKNLDWERLDQDSEEYLRLITGV